MFLTSPYIDQAISLIDPESPELGVLSAMAIYRQSSERDPAGSAVM